MLVERGAWCCFLRLEDGLNVLDEAWEGVVYWKYIRDVR